MSVALSVENLIKNYGNNTVIKNISFNVKQGEIFGLLGVNGAGKTTILECIEGIRKYNSGNIKIEGKMGIQLQSSSLPSHIKVIEVMNLFSKWNKVPVDLKLIKTFSLDELKNKMYKEISIGQKRRLHLALALIGNPDLIFLDEPTAGLDVEGRVSLHDEIRKMKNQGKTIIMSSHDMAEVETLCDRIAILKSGNIAFNGSVKALTNEIGGKSTIYIKTSIPLKINDLNECIYNKEDQGYLLFDTNNLSNSLFELLTLAKEQNTVVVDIKIQQATLEQRFMDIAKEVKA